MELIRNGIATVSTSRISSTDRQRITYFKRIIATHHIPESFVVFLSGSALNVHFLLSVRGHLNGSRSGSRQHGINLHLIFQTLDLVTQRSDIIGHLVILFEGSRIDHAVLIAMIFQEILGLFPQSVALVAQFKDLIHQSLPP